MEEQDNLEVNNLVNILNDLVKGQKAMLELMSQLSVK